MPDEPSLGEIARAVARVEQTLGRLVHTDVYNANRLADQERMARLEVDLRAERGEREKLEDRRASDRRWIVAAIVVPVAGLLLQLYLASKGAP